MSRRGNYFSIGGHKKSSGATGPVTQPFAAPVNTVAPSISGTPAVGNTLTFTPGTWTGTPAPTLTRQWTADGVDIPGATALTFVITSAQQGKTISAYGMADNGQGLPVRANSSNSLGPVPIPAGLAAPVNTVAPSVSGTAQVGLTLTATPGTWTGNPAPSITGKWQADGVDTGITALTYVQSSGDLGKSLIYRETATNSQGTVSQNSNAKGPVAAAPAGITAPVLTKLSAAGVAPFKWDIFFPDNTTVPGMDLQTQVSTDPTMATGITFDVTQEMVNGDFAGDIPIAGFATWTGQRYLRQRTRRLDGVDSPWSNIIGDNIVTSVATFNAVAGVDRSPNLTFSNGNKTLHGVAAGTLQSARANAVGNDKGQFEISWDTISTFASGIHLGFDNGTTAFSTNGSAPGRTNSQGVVFAVNKGNTGPSIMWNSAAGQSFPTMPDIAQAGDKFSMTPNRTAGTMKTYRTRAGSPLLLATTTVPGLSGFTKAFAGMSHDDFITGNFGAEPWGHAPDSGDTFYA